MATIDDPGAIEGTATRASESKRSGVRVERPVPVLVLGLERWADDARGGVVDERVERAKCLDLLGDARRGDVPAHEHRLRAELAQLLCRLLRSGVRAEVPDRNACRAVASKTQGNRLADPTGAS